MKSVSSIAEKSTQDTINWAELNRNIAAYPWICKLIYLCQNADHSRLRIIEGFIKSIWELDNSTRNAFLKVFSNKKYGSFTFVFRAGKCIGFDWKNLHRKPRV